MNLLSQAKVPVANKEKHLTDLQLSDIGSMSRWHLRLFPTSVHGTCNRMIPQPARSPRRLSGPLHSVQSMKDKGISQERLVFA
jgi:hypothetical protein